MPSRSPEVLDAAKRQILLHMHLKQLDNPENLCLVTCLRVPSPVPEPYASDIVQAALERLMEAGLVEAHWDTCYGQCPPQYAYRLTAAGISEARRVAEGHIAPEPVPA